MNEEFSGVSREEAIITTLATAGAKSESEEIKSGNCKSKNEVRGVLD